MSRIRIIVFGMLTGCAKESLPDITVSSATLSFDMAQQGMVGFIGGYGTNDAVLTVVDTDGMTWSMPVELSGTLLGFGGGIALNFILDQQLELGEDGLLLEEVLGDYSGKDYAFDPSFGVSYLDVENEAGCRIHAWSLDVGANLLVGNASLNLHTTDDPELAPDPSATE